MRSKRSWHARRLSLTPLIDIIFLLLLFFMLSSTFTRFAEVPLNTAVAGAGGADVPMPILIQVSNQNVRVNGLDLALSQVVARLEALRPEGEGVGVVALVDVTEDATAQDLVDLLVALRQTAWLQIDVLG